MILDYREYITEKASKGLVNYISRETNTALFDHMAICPYCKTKIENTVYSKFVSKYPDWLFGSFEQSENVVQCPTCGWWEYKYRNQSDAIIDGIRASDIEYSSAILRIFDNASMEVPLEVLRTYLLKKPELIYEIDAHKMEDLVRSVLSDFFPNCEVKHFGKTRDGGRDGLLVDSEGNQTLLQVKRRTNADSTEGVVALRELMGVAILEDNLKGCIFVSTADHFSMDAEKYAQQVLDKKIVEKFELVNCEEFISRLNIVQENIPQEWKKLIRLDKR